MKCNKNGCENSLTGKQTMWCSLKCSKLGLKARYKKKYPNKVKEWKTKYLSFMKYIGKNEKISIKKIYNNKCCRCGDIQRLCIHHIKPMSVGGDNSRKNLMILCDDCHKLWHKMFNNDFWIIEKPTD